MEVNRGQSATNQCAGGRKTERRAEERGEGGLTVRVLKKRKRKKLPLEFHGISFCLHSGVLHKRMRRVELHWDEVKIEK